DEGEVRRRLAAVAAGFDVEGDLLAVVEVGEAGALERRDVHEDVLRALLRLDEAEALGGVEPFHGAVGHREISCLGRCPRSAAARRRSEQNRMTEADDGDRSRLW